MSNLVPSLLRRVHALQYFHCDGPFGDDVRALIGAGRSVTMRDCNVHWMDWTRYSARQDARMQLGGFIGEATYDPIPPEVLTYLAWGELLHIGKASAFGLGKYELTAVPP